MTPFPQLVEHIPAFQASYDAEASDAIWLQLRTVFRSFWATRVMSSGHEPIADEDCDPVIRILDRNGKGNTKGSQSVARAMIAQGAWRRMFNELHTNKALGLLLDKALVATDPLTRASAIDQLYSANAGVPNYLTGPSGNAVCAFLAAHDPLSNLSIISLKDRKAVIDHLGLSLPFDWDSATVGTKIATTNIVILDALKTIGLDASARTVSTFFYSAGVVSLWKGVHTVAMPNGGSVSVSVPDTDEDDAVPVTPKELIDAEMEISESMQIQALLAKIGTEMGFAIWLPKGDRSRVLKAWTPGAGQLVEALPLGYDPTTTATIEQIDVLWLKGRSIVRAFEVEHTTSIYSGILRMADLVALQPNISVKLHIVASIERRDKVLREIRRPVFSLLDGLVLWKTCTYLSYDRVRDISELKHLNMLKDAVLNEYEEVATGEISST